MKYQALSILRAGVHSGEYYEATDETGSLIGYTLWMPPGQEMFSTFVSRLQETPMSAHHLIAAKSRESSDSKSLCVNSLPRLRTTIEQQFVLVLLHLLRIVKTDVFCSICHNFRDSWQACWDQPYVIFWDRIFLDDNSII